MKVLLLAAVFVGCVYAQEWTPKTAEELMKVRDECENSKGSLRNFCIVSKIDIYDPKKKEFYIDRVVRQFYVDPDINVAPEIVKACIDKHKDVEKEEEKVHLIFWCFRHAPYEQNKE